jgi:hypothetical protein
VVTHNRIRCTVVAVSVSPERWTSRGALAKEIMPGSDPYVAQLIQKLQDEVREERRMRSLVRRYRPRYQNGTLDSFAGN